jgi:hypothetical protein
MKPKYKIGDILLRNPQQWNIPYTLTITRITDDTYYYVQTHLASNMKIDSFQRIENIDEKGRFILMNDLGEILYGK